MTKLYLSGGIANVPDFKEIFEANAEALEAAGYEVVNPVDVKANCTPRHECDESDCKHVVGQNKCLTLGEPGTPGDPHSWACYLRYDLIAMLECDAVAIIESTFWNSKGAHLEESVAMQVLMPRFPVQYWLDAAQKLPVYDVPTF